MKQVLRRSLVPVVAALALALAAAPLFAAGPPAPGPRGPLAGYLHCLGVAGLTDVQKADVKALLEAARPGTEALLATLKSDREALHAAVTAAAPDACAVGTALLKVEADLKAIGEDGKALRTAIEALLTPEQKLKLEGCLKAPRPHGAEDESEEV
jgi:Spy/CpxP family protein refolding chaperone